jgi:hypothetical protein
MALVIPNESAAAYPALAKLDSKDLLQLSDAISNNGVLDGLACSTNTGLNVAVAAGSAFAGGVTVRYAGGTVAVTSDPTDPRFSLVYIDNTGAVAVSQSTPSQNPELPAVPAGAVPLCLVYVPAATSTLTAGMLTDRRIVLAHPLTLWRTSTQVLAENSVAEVTLVNVVIPANSLRADRAVRISASGYWNNSRVGDAVATLRIVLGPFTIGRIMCLCPQTNNFSYWRFNWEWKFFFSTIAHAYTAEFDSGQIVNPGRATPAGFVQRNNVAPVTMGGGTSSAAVNTTTDLTFQLGVTWSDADALLDWNLYTAEMAIF